MLIVASDVPVTRRCSHVKKTMTKNSTHGGGSREPGLAVLERLEVDEQRRRQRRLLRAAEVGGIDLVEHLPRADDPERHDEVDLRPQHRDDDVAGSASTTSPRRSPPPLRSSGLMFCSPPRKISIIVPLVVQIVISMMANIATRRSAQPLPPRQLEDLAAQPRRLVVDAEHAEHVVDQPVGLVEPVDVLDRQDAVDESRRSGTGRARSA